MELNLQVLVTFVAVFWCSICVASIFLPFTTDDSEKFDPGAEPRRRLQAAEYTTPSDTFRTVPTCKRGMRVFITQNSQASSLEA